MHDCTASRRFTPTTAQLEPLAELQTAKTPQAVIAARLGVDQATFKTWMARLDTARDYVEPIPSTAELLGKILPNGAQREHELRAIRSWRDEG